MNPGGRRGGKSTAPAGAAVQPPKPSGMKVNQFQQASREARARNNRASDRTAKRMAELERQPQRYMAGDDGGRQNIKGRVKGRVANAYRAGRLDPERMARQSGRVQLTSGRRLGNRAPATRLY